MVADTRNLTLFHDAPTGLDFAAEIGETTPVSWQPKGNLSFEEWIAIGNTLQQVNASLNWWIGDWLIYGEGKWGEMYAQAVETTGWDYDRLSKAKWVAARVQFCKRLQNLTWSHHHEVASLDPEAQEKWLMRAEAERWSVRRLREEIKGPKLPPLAVSFREPTEAPFNHQPRVDVPPAERNEVDEYEQQADQLAEDEAGYDWTVETVHYPEKPEEIHVNGNGKMSVHFSSDTPEHYTPREIIDAVIECMGAIDLDPCSNSYENPNVPAEFHFTQADDGLSRHWAGRVYMNPPYGREIGKWVEKLCSEYELGNVTEAIALVPARTDTDWFDRLIDGYRPQCFVHGRLVFIGNDNSAPFPSAIVYLGDNLESFFHTFRSFGRVVQELHPSMIGA